MRALAWIWLVLVAQAWGASEDKAQFALPLSGKIFTDVYVPSRNTAGAELNQVSASLWLQADPKLGEHGSARFLLAGDRLERSASYSPQFRTNLREGYVDYARNGWELRLGRQIIPWGKSDVVNPTDFLTAKDYGFFNPDDETRRLGATSVFLSYAPGASAWLFTAVWTPVFPQSTLLIPASAIPPGITLTNGTITPAFTLPHSEGAIKAAYLGTGWDASLLYFRGWNHAPELVVSAVSASGSPPSVSATLGQGFHRQQAAGGDLAFTTGAWTLRAESAYVWTENNDGTNPLVVPSHADGVLGAERPIADDFRVQAQAVLRYFPRYLKPSDATGPDAVTAAVNARVAAANALLLNYQDRFRPAATVRLGYAKDSSGIEAEIFAMANLVGGDYLVRPKLTYAWTDALKTTVGTDYYGGDRGRPLGSLNVYDAVFVEGKYSF